MPFPLLTHAGPYARRRFTLARADVSLQRSYVIEKHINAKRARRAGDMR